MESKKEKVLRVIKKASRKYVSELQQHRAFLSDENFDAVADQILAELELTAAPAPDLPPFLVAKWKAQLEGYYSVHATAEQRTVRLAVLEEYGWLISMYVGDKLKQFEMMENKEQYTTPEQRYEAAVQFMKQDHNGFDTPEQIFYKALRIASGIGQIQAPERSQAEILADIAYDLNDILEDVDESGKTLGQVITYLRSYKITPKPKQHTNH